MNSVVQFTIFAAIVAVTISSPISPIQIQAGFEYLGAAEGKSFVRPIYVNSTTDRLTYQEAIARCASAGYRIATIESQAQNDVVGPYADSRWTWIDGVGFQTPDVFFSINTGKNLTYFNWSKWAHRPVIGKDDYICIRISLDAEWLDVQCTDKNTVTCEV